MVPAITHSFLGRYLQYAQPLTSAPYHYHLAVGLGLLAAAVRRNVWFDHAGDRLHPNLWVCLLGDSGILCKSTSLNLGVRVLRATGQDWLYPADFSLQRMYDVMKARPQGLLVYREFRAFVGLLERDYMAGAKAVITDLYDCPPFIEYEKVHEAPGKIPDPALSILAATTISWFCGRETQRDLEAGFLARFLFVPAWPGECGERKALPPGHEASAGARDQLAAELANIAACRGRIRLTPEAETIYEVWFARHTQLSPFREGRWAPFLARFEAMVLKVAVLLHLARGQDNLAPVDPDTMTAATVLLGWFEDRLWRCLEGEVAFTPHEGQRLKVLRLIPNGGAEVAQRALLQATRIPLRDLLRMLETLEAEGVVAKRREPGVGRPSFQWRRLS